MVVILDLMQEKSEKVELRYSQWALPTATEMNYGICHLNQKMKRVSFLIVLKNSNRWQEERYMKVIMIIVQYVSINNDDTSIVISKEKYLTATR